MDIAEITNLRKTGAEALRRGDFRVARDSFQRLADAGQADVTIWTALGGTAGRLGDAQAAHAAVDRALALDPRNLRALLLKGDLLAQSGDARGASAFYTAALGNAPPLNQLTADLRVDLQRASAMCDRYRHEFESFLLDRLRSAGYESGSSAPRFAHSLDLMLGRRQIYQQQPRSFYFPELPQIQFYEREQFPWLDRVEAATDDIRQELMALLEDTSAFQPYLQNDPRVPRSPENRLIDNPQWSAAYLWKHGEPVTENLERCPRTVAALAEVPTPHIPYRSPSILFSMMKPGAHIHAHHGFVNTRLIGHLPLIVPPGCHFRVGNEERQWVEGKAWVFDDTIEHEAWNRSDRTRVVLIFEIWRPELTMKERDLVSAMFEAIDAYDPGSAKWTD